MVSALLQQAFSIVCGQNPAHAWVLGGLLLPCCQRCVGLYAGATFAILVQILLRPNPTGRFLKCHGLFLAQMIPFGFHWVAQGPILRTATGFLFGFGVVAFLWLAPRVALGMPLLKAEGRLWWYYVTLVLGLIGVLAAASSGGRVAGLWLMAWVLIGWLALAVLLSANLALGLVALSRLVFQAFQAGPGGRQ
jgi:uncharacterized membrane protein